MKKRLNIYTLLIALVVIWGYSPKNTAAVSLDASGGVKNESTYQEVVFISGKPVVFKATSAKDTSITEKISGNKLTQTYKLKLTGTNGKDTLSRQIDYESTIEEFSEIGQKTINGTVKKYSEKIIIDGITYTLKDYQFTNGTITDSPAASDYYSGNSISTKIYTVPGTRTQPAQEIVVKTDSRHVGYENFWGATDTQITEYEIVNGKGEVGTVTNRVSTSKSRVLNYEENAASMASFNGGYSVISSVDMVSQYTYDLPFGAGKGEISLNAENTPKIERLIVPKFRDIANSNAKDAVEKLYSLGILEDRSNFFSPNTPMTRLDFTVALAKAVDLRVLEAKKTKAKDTTSVFKDVKRTVKDYAYLETAVQKGIVKGKSAELFDPNGFVTRGQVATIMVRALGLENRAPDPGYNTDFADDAQIPGYARDGIYIVNELGLMTGDSVTNKFNPNKPLTRAQASLVLIRFLNYLENDLKQNYRDDILFFN